jgi:predicted metal-dependent hydrolase
MRARDALGRPVPAGSPDAVDPVPEEALPPEDAVRRARELLEAGRAFSAHEVLEASWKAAPPEERDLWQGLAQVCVGLTHLQRGNRVGAARLLRRGADRLVGRPAAYGVDVPRVAGEALHLAEQVEAGTTTGSVQL